MRRLPGFAHAVLRDPDGETIGTMREAQRILNEEGLVVDGKRHPAFDIMNAAQTTARLAAAELGLTPVSRSRPAIREDDDADALLD